MYGGGTAMSLEGVELNVGGTSFKGVWVAILLSMASTLGGGIWGASQFFSRIDSIEGKLGAIVVPDLTNTHDRLSLVEQRIADQNIQGLQGKLAELGTNLEQIMERQKELIDLRDRVADAEVKVSESVLKVDAQADVVKKYDDEMKKINREINDLWNGLDAVSNPLK